MYGLYTGRIRAVTVCPITTAVGSVKSSEPGTVPRSVPVHDGRSSSMGADHVAPESALRITYALQWMALQVRTSVNVAPSSIALPSRKRISTPSLFSVTGP